MSGSSLGLSHSQPSQEVGNGTQVALTPVLIQKLWSVRAPFVSWLPHFILVEGNYVYSSAKLGDQHVTRQLGYLCKCSLPCK